MISQEAIESLKKRLPHGWVDMVIQKIEDQHGVKYKYATVYALIRVGSKNQILIDAALQVAEEHEQNVANIAMRAAGKYSTSSNQN